MIHDGHIKLLTDKKR